MRKSLDESTMARQYLHLSAYSCDNCKGPVVSGWLALRESEITKETDIRQVGALCLACGHKQSRVTKPGVTRGFLPVDWEPVDFIDRSQLKVAFDEMRGRLR